MWTFTVASATPSSRAITLFEAPCVRQRRIWASRSDSLFWSAAGSLAGAGALLWLGRVEIRVTADPAVPEQMLRNMFIGDPPGNTDRILDFSTAVTGGLFFSPTVEFLDDPDGTVLAIVTAPISEAELEGEPVEGEEVAVLFGQVAGFDHFWFRSPLPLRERG